MFTVSLTRKMHCLYRGDLTSVSNAFASSLKNVRDDFKSFHFPCLLSILLPFWPVLTLIWTLKWPIAQKLAGRMHLTSTMCPRTCTKKNKDFIRKHSSLVLLFIRNSTGYLIDFLGKLTDFFWQGRVLIFSPACIYYLNASASQLTVQLSRKGTEWPPCQNICQPGHFADSTLLSLEW